MKSDKQHARDILHDCGIELGADFHTLERSKIDLLLAYADRERYRKPRSANGSRARYYHARLQRKAKDRPFRGFVR